MRLEYKNEIENAFKFWEVKIEGKKVITTYGRIDKTKNPAIVVKSKDGEKAYNIPVGAHLSVEKGSSVIPGTILSKIPRMIGQSRDITGGLPRVTELFEARNPSNPAVVSEIDGVVSYGGIKRGNREIFIESKDGFLNIPYTTRIFFAQLIGLYISNMSCFTPTVQL